MEFLRMFWLLLVTALLLDAGQVAADSPTLTMQDAVVLAQARDPWTAGSLLQQQALEASSIAAGSLPNPRMEMGFANLPVDSFDFNQESMTQFKVGVSQSFSRGKSLTLQREQLELRSQQQPYLRLDREARVTVLVSNLWLDAYLARETIALINADRSLFEYLIDVSQAAYSSGIGSARQQDIIRAQLELTRLDDRLVVLQQNYDAAISRLQEWFASDYPADSQPFTLAEGLPGIEVAHFERLRTPGPLEPNWVATQLLQHPALLSVEKEIDAEAKDIELAEQNYKPQWGVNASYGYREDGPQSVSRADFFSIGLTFDLPLFTANRQDQVLRASIAHTDSVKTRKWLLLRSMSAQLETLRVDLFRLDQRKLLYQTQLLAQMHDQAEAALSAYTSDDGDFAEVVRAQIAELNAKIDALDIDISRDNVLIQLNYFFAAAGDKR